MHLLGAEALQTQEEGKKKKAKTNTRMHTKTSASQPFKIKQSSKKERFKEATGKTIQSLAHVCVSCSWRSCFCFCFCFSFKRALSLHNSPLLQLNAWEVPEKWESERTCWTSINNNQTIEGKKKGGPRQCNRTNHKHGAQERGGGSREIKRATSRDGKNQPS